MSTKQRLIKRNAVTAVKPIRRQAAASKVELAQQVVNNIVDFDYVDEIDRYLDYFLKEEDIDDYENRGAEFIDDYVKRFKKFYEKYERQTDEGKKLILQEMIKQFDELLEQRKKFEEAYDRFDWYGNGYQQ